MEKTQKVERESISKGKEARAIVCEKDSAEL